MKETADDLADKRVVLTGATGFVGARVLVELASRGARVFAIVRNRRGADRVTRAGAEPISIDLADTTGLTDILRDADALVHLAYDIRASAGENLANFDGLLAAAQQAGTARVVHASSVVVYDDWLAADIDETSPVSAPGGSPYRQAKMRMEERLLESGLSTAILQPTLVYGPHSSLWTDRLAGALAHGGVVLPQPQGICNAVHVDDVAQAVVCALNTKKGGAERYLISGPAPVRWTDLLEGYARIVGGEIHREPAEAMSERLGPEPEHRDTPSLAARVSATGRRLIGNDRFEALTGLLRRGGDGPLQPDHHLFGVFTCKGAVSIDKAREQLGYAPAFDLEKGLAATEPYLRQKFGSHA